MSKELGFHHKSVWTVDIFLGNNCKSQIVLNKKEIFHMWKYKESLSFFVSFSIKESLYEITNFISLI